MRIDHPGLGGHHDRAPGGRTRDGMCRPATTARRSAMLGRLLDRRTGQVGGPPGAMDAPAPSRTDGTSLGAVERAGTTRRALISRGLWAITGAVGLGVAGTGVALGAAEEPASAAVRHSSRSWCTTSDLRRPRRSQAPCPTQAPSRRRMAPCTTRPASISAGFPAARCPARAARSRSNGSLSQTAPSSGWGRAVSTVRSTPWSVAPAATRARSARTLRKSGRARTGAMPSSRSASQEQGGSHGVRRIPQDRRHRRRKHG